MHELATISKIQDIQPIPDKDRIVLATVENYHSIVKKDEFKPGDKVIYVYYDAILPVRPEFEFLRKRCWSEKVQGFRIRPMKMGDAVSEGLVLPLSLIPGGDRLAVGTVVTGMLGIRRYDPDAQAPKIQPKRRWWMRYPVIREFLEIFGFPKETKAKGYPEEVPKSDEENIEKCWDKVKRMKTDFIVTEKMEGTAAMYVLDKRKRLHTYSHNWETNGEGIWGEVARKNNIEAGLLKVLRKMKERIAIEGEICGPGIQKNIYGFDKPRFFLYSAYNADTGERLSYPELLKIAAMMEIEKVPYIKTSGILPDVEEMLKDAEGNSLFGTSVPREGLVWRTEDGTVHFKCKSRPYKVWFGA